MDRLNVNILVICETGWGSNGDSISNTHKIIHASEEKKSVDIDNDIMK